MAQENNNEVVRVTTSEIIYDSVDTYARKFKASGIEKSDVQSLVASAADLFNSTDATTDEIDARIEDLRNRNASINNTIEVAFSDVKAAVEANSYRLGVV